MDHEDALPFFELWCKIDIAESYLVSSLYEDAASLSESVLESLRESSFAEYTEVHEILLSAGMVLVQSLHGLGRTANIMDKIKDHFPAIETIPTEVLITGVCLQISDNCFSEVSNPLENFLTKWTLVDESFYVYEENNKTINPTKLTLSLREYVDVVEVYTVSVLGRSLKNWDLAIEWVENASLPQDVKQGFLRKLVSLSLGEEIAKPQTELDNHKRSLPSTNGGNNIEESPPSAKRNPRNKQSLVSPLLHLKWLPLKLKLGGMQLQFTNSNVALGCLLILLYFIFRRKGAAFIRFVKERSTLAKKALLDFWHLAFSYQVNPLAAVQSLPLPARPQ